MGIITGYKRNILKSLIYSNKWRDVVERNKCYLNIFNIVTGWDLDENIKIAFGYWGKPYVSMIRHCFFVLNNEIIDPTLGSMDIEGSKYHIFKLFDQWEYTDIFFDFYNNNPSGIIYDSLIGMIPEEREYCQYVIENNLHIDKQSYLEFLKRYDKDNKVIIAKNE